MTGDERLSWARWRVHTVSTLLVLYYCLCVGAVAVFAFDYVTTAGCPAWLAVLGAVAFGWIAGTRPPARGKCR